ncbi:hypothetical protein, partial [Nostoc linckia]
QRGRGEGVDKERSLSGGNLRSELRRERLLPCPSYPQCPMPNAQCPMPNAQCPMPDAQCPMPNAQ